MQEEWKKVPYADRYSVSNYGRVRNDETRRILKHIESTSSHTRVFLYSGTTRHAVLVHRLVAELFIPNSEGLPEVRHINFDKTDVRVSNLEWSEHHCAKPVKAVFPSGNVVKYRTKGAVYKALGSYQGKVAKSLDSGNTFKGVALTTAESDELLRNQE